MENYKIWIDEAGAIKAILLPSKEDFKVYGYIPNIPTIESTHPDYEKALSKAKQEGVRFKEIPENLFPSHWNLKDKSFADTLHDIPEGYRVEIVPSDTIVITKKAFESGEKDLNTHFHAILKKLEPVQKPIRKTVYAFMQLPYHEKIRIAKEVDCWNDEFVPYTEQQKCEAIFKLVKANNKLDALMKLLGTEPVQPTPSEKEDLRKRFEEKFTYQGLGERWISHTAGNQIFDFFYSEIEAAKKLQSHALNVGREQYNKGIEDLEKYANLHYETHTGIEVIRKVDLESLIQKLKK